MRTRELRAIVEPFAARLGAPRVLGDGQPRRPRGVPRARCWTSAAADPLRPVDRVDELDGLRVVTLDSTVPGRALTASCATRSSRGSRGVLATPAPLGTILAMHHPPVPSVLPLAASVELRDQSRLASVLRGTDVRAIIAGHLHYSTFATFAGIPVSVASATCYAQDLTVPVGGTRPQDGAQAFNLVHVYDDTIVHSVVPVDAPRTLEYIDAAEAQRRRLASWRGHRPRQRRADGCADRADRLCFAELVRSHGARTGNIRSSVARSARTRTSSGICARPPSLRQNMSTSVRSASRSMRRSDAASVVCT